MQIQFIQNKYSETQSYSDASFSYVKKIQDIIKDYGRLEPNLKISFTQEMLDLYEKTLNENPANRDLALYSAYAYGRCIYAIDFNKSAQFLRISLAEILFKHKVSGLTSLEVLRELPIEKMVEDENLLLDLIKKCPEDTLLLAQNLRWLGHSYQNISEYNSKTHNNISRFNLVYDTCEKILSKIVEICGIYDEIGKDANWELVELYYNTTRFRYNLTHEDDPVQRLSTLDKLKGPLKFEGDTSRSLKIKAQIENIHIIELRPLLYKEIDPTKHQILLKQNWDHICKAVEISNHKDFPDLFLRAMFYNNKASMALEHILVPLEEIDPWVKIAIEFASKSGDNHAYFPFFYKTAATLSMQQGDIQVAKIQLAKAINIFSLFPDQSKDRSILQKMLDNLE